MLGYLTGELICFKKKKKNLGSEARGIKQVSLEEQINVEGQIFDLIIWRDSLEVNPCILIGSILVGILPYGPFPWKRNGHKLCIFFVCFRKPANSNFATKTTKRKRVNALIFAKNLPKRLTFLQSLQ